MLLDLTNPQPKTMMYHKEGVLSFVKELIRAYERGELGGTTHEVHPELRKDSRENFLYFTLAPAINFQRKSEALWRAAYETYQDETTRFVFFPEESARPFDEYFQALSKHSLASFPRKHTEIWYRIAQTLARHYAADPRTLLSRCDYDVVQIRNELLHRKSEFPYLSGPKLANYWLYMLSCFTDAPIVNRESITVIPDVHVIRASVRLHLVELNADRDRVADAWASVLHGTSIAPVDVHAPLWRWSRMGFPNIGF